LERVVVEQAAMVGAGGLPQNPSQVGKSVSFRSRFRLAGPRAASTLSPDFPDKLAAMNSSTVPPPPARPARARLRLTLGARLFLAALAAFLAVGAAGVLLVRWNVPEAAPGIATGDLALAGRLADDVADRYRARRDWSFLPADATARQRWLDAELARLQAAAAPGGPAAFPCLGYRIALLDAAGRTLAGARAGRVLVAVASVDTVWLPLAVDARSVGTLVVAHADDRRSDLAIAFLIDQQRHLELLAIVGLALAVLAAAWLAAGFRRPIGQLVDGARRLGAGRLETRLDARRGDELGELARTFNQLAARLGDTEQRRREWIATTSHELRTPLAVLRAQLEALQDGVRPATPENLALARQQVLALGTLVEDLGALARADVEPLQCAPTRIDAWQLLHEVVDGSLERLAAAGLGLALSAPPARRRVTCDADRLRQVLLNLLENSLRYTAPGGRIQITGSAAGGELRIAVEDTAPGVPDEALPRLGERFFRVDASRSRRLGGAGLGLALCRQILEAHGGRLEFAASALGGLRATVVLALEAREG
jgi:two-component system sensor histidine kinase BaeS